MLFGDGAGAVVLKADEETGILSTHLHSDGSKKELLWNPVGVSTGFKGGANGGGTINMKGNDVFKYAVKALDSVVDETLAANGLDKSDLDWLIDPSTLLSSLIFLLIFTWSANILHLI